MALALRSCEIASYAASCTTATHSAPLNPALFAARLSSKDVSPCRLRSKIAFRDAASGGGTYTRRSSRPGRISAGSSTSGRLVAATTVTPTRAWIPSISCKSCVSIRSEDLLSWLGASPPSIPLRAVAMASISSKKIMLGADSRARRKRTCMFPSLSPRNFERSSGPLTARKLQFASYGSGGVVSVRSRWGQPKPCTPCTPGAAWRRPTFVGKSSGHERLAASRRSVQEHTTWRRDPQLGEGIRVFPGPLHHFLEALLHAVHATDVSPRRGRNVNGDFTETRWSRRRKRAPEVRSGEPEGSLRILVHSALRFPQRRQDRLLHHEMKICADVAMRVGCDLPQQPFINGEPAWGGELRSPLQGHQNLESSLFVRYPNLYLTIFKETHMMRGTAQKVPGGCTPFWKVSYPIGPACEARDPERSVGWSSPRRKPSNALRHHQTARGTSKSV
eukprot:scaffold149_cov315-Pinguiococcus_pyrenoidosus.AAC.130